MQKCDSTTSNSHVKFFSPIVQKIFFILLIFNFANDKTSDFIKTNKITLIKDYYNYSFHSVGDKSKVDSFVKATSDLVAEIAKIDEFILETNALSQLIGIIEFCVEVVILYVFSFFLTKFYIRNKV